MITERFVTNLELSKKLKEMGVKQESDYYRVPFYGKMRLVSKNQFIKIKDDYNKDDCVYSAFHAGELMGMLPSYIRQSMDAYHDHIYDLNIFKISTYGVNYYDIENKSVYFSKNCVNKTLSNALALMLIELHNRGVVKW